MPNSTIKIKRGSAAPVSLNPGEFAMDQANRKLYIGKNDGTPLVVGGDGTFATKTYVDTAISTGAGSFGTMSGQNANNVTITGGNINGTTIGASGPMSGNFTSLATTSLTATGGSINSATIGAATPSTGAFTSLTASTAPTSANDVVRKSDLDSAISDLGSVFRYAGDISQSNVGTTKDLNDLPDKATGAYYRVDVAGVYNFASVSYTLKVGDALVRTPAGWQKLDNVDAEVKGTLNEIVVSGDDNLGYTISIDPNLTLDCGTY